MRRELGSIPRLAFVTTAVTVALVACGARGPLDDLQPTNSASGNADASVLGPVGPGGGPVGSGSNPPSSGPADPGGPVAEDAGAPGRDAGVIGSVLECGTCVTKTCSTPIFDCLKSESCRSTFQCVVSTCLGKGGGTGGINPLCLFTCGASDPAGALEALGVFQCLMGSCGPDCGSLIGGLGGLLGGGKKIAADGELPNEVEAPFSPEAFREVMSPWPALMSTPAQAR